ncbi:MAG TPA: hypothetical protein PKE69_11935 [Pyrinomonadaceae bacterium]|nr:hypothetical protein [Pyrinomonadaceae bacterium]
MLKASELSSNTELIYWIDKEFVQYRAKHLLGRELTDEEIRETTKLIEYGLGASVFEIIDIAIDETSEIFKNT